MSPTNWWLTPQAREVQEKIAKDLLGWTRQGAVTGNKKWWKTPVGFLNRDLEPLDWRFVGACLEVLVDRDWFFSKVSGGVVTGELYAEARDYFRIDAPDLKSAILEAAKVEAKA